MNARIKIAMTVLALVAGVDTGSAQQAAKPGNGVKITLRGVPNDDAAQVNGLYVVSDAGAIRLPHLAQRLNIAGLNADQIGAAIENAYKKAQIYDRPAVEAIIVQEPVPEPDAASISVGGQVNRTGKIPFKQGMKLVEAIQAAGDRTIFGSRNMELLRNGKITLLDYRKPDVKSLILQPGDVITVKQVPAFPPEIDRG